MQITCCLAAGVVGRELHGTDAGATLALHLACAAHADALESFGQRFFLGRHPARDGSHGTETAPCTGSIDERQNDAYDGGDEDDGPEYTPHVAPVLGEAQLYAEHGEDEDHHQQPEPEGTDELWYGSVGRVFREKTVIHASSRTDVAAPVSASPDGGQHRTYHADECQQANHRIEPSDDEVGEKDPIEWQTFGLEMPVEVLFLVLLLFHVVFFFCFDCKITKTIIEI